MIKVNLVPADILARAAQRQLLLQIAIVGAGLLVVLTGTSAAHYYGKYKLEQELAYNEVEFQRLSKIVAQVEELEKAAAAVRARLNVIEELLRGRAFYPLFMTDFARTVPTGVRVLSLNTSAQGGGALRLNISASALSNEDIAAWLRVLENDPRFGSIELGAVTASGDRLYNFTVNMAYNLKP